MNARRWSPDIMEIGDRIAALTAAGAADLNRYLDEVYGVRAPVSAPVRRELISDPLPPAPPTPTVFALRLDGYEAASKLAVVRAVRQLTGLGLKEALDLVGRFPCVVKEGLDRDEAERVKDTLEAAGARMSLA
jgi:large subunit ribosomal protein L7/L12